MGRCPYLKFDLPDGIGIDRSQGKFYCEKTNDRLHADTLQHVCDCIYEDKFEKCENFE